MVVRSAKRMTIEKTERGPVPSVEVELSERHQKQGLSDGIRFAEMASDGGTG